MRWDCVVVSVCAKRRVLKDDECEVGAGLAVTNGT